MTALNTISALRNTFGQETVSVMGLNWGSINF